MTAAALQILKSEVKPLGLKDGNGKLTIPKKYIEKLGYKYQDELYIIAYNQKLMIMNDENFSRLETHEGVKVKKTTLAGFKTPRTFVFQIYINKEYMKDLGLVKNIHMVIHLKDYGLIISKYKK
jgi:bifunctional DNA-binding transcriptional regulator/antitoxin component of YhaV-PrlF toxin-antitoxin module